MREFALCLLIAALALAAAPPAGAASLAAGARIRWATSTDPTPAIGRAVSLSSDTLVAARQHTTVAIPLSALTSLEVSGGRADPGRSILYGAVAGGVLALGAAALIDAAVGKETDLSTPGSHFFLGAFVVGAAAGGTIGALVGASRERWERADPAGVSFGLGLGARPQPMLGFTLRY